MADPLRLASLISSRICHDLISPVGAISNGLELLAMAGPQAGAEEMGLLQESARDAAARLRFLRIAFGAASAGEKISAAELSSIARAHLTTGRLRMIWRPAEDEFERATARIVLLTAAAAVSALPIGGTIAVERVQDAPLATRVRFDGDRVGLDDRARAIIAGETPVEEADPRHAHLSVLRAHAEETGARIAIRMEEAGGDVSFV